MIINNKIKVEKKNEQKKHSIIWFKDMVYEKLFIEYK